MECSNLYADLPGASIDEVIEQLAGGREFSLHRIASAGQATPPGDWYDQDFDEWVILLTGAATLQFEDGNELLEMRPGDYVLIPAHHRHRVEWTVPDKQTVWLAIHFIR